MMRKFMINIIFILTGTFSKADTIYNVDMGLTVAPYVLSIDDDKPLRTIGKVMLTQMSSVGLYTLSVDKIDAWALSATTNAALVCNLQEKEFCAVSILSAGYIIYNKNTNTQNTIRGALVGTASGALIPGIIANF